MILEQANVRSTNLTVPLDMYPIQDMYRHFYPMLDRLY